MVKSLWTHECKRVTAEMFVLFVLGFPSQVFRLSDVSWWAGAKTKTHSTNRRLNPTLIKPRPSCPRLHTHFSSTPSQVPASVSQRVTAGAHTPESLSRVPGGISGACSSITLGSDKHTHVSRCIFFALPVSAGPSNHLWSTTQFPPLLFTTHADGFQITVPSSRWCQRHSAPRPHQTLHLPPRMSWFHNVFWTRPAQV